MRIKISFLISYTQKDAIKAAFVKKIFDKPTICRAGDGEDILWYWVRCQRREDAKDAKLVSRSGMFESPHL
ncbi:MAG: hypothetical protein JW882_10680 [Deltaproteobacteria bacterium]|nr:hypothetical protein [Deltaproteobacteria bacterium]